MSFRALFTTKSDDKQIETNLIEMAEDDLMPGDVTIDVEWSTVNYKDGLALSGAPGIIQSYPMIGGIDLAGTVTSSEDARYKPGDKVLINGWALSQTHFGGYAEKARVKSDWLIKVPDTFTTRQTMAIGTAGYTAMLSILALEHNGVTPEKGPVLVTGANGGVGSIAIAVLSNLGFEVIASTGRMDEEAYLKGLGATSIIDRTSLSEPGRPLGKERWAGAVDAVGSHTLVNVLAQTQYRGAVAACGLAQGPDLPATVMPFILRNVTLAGIDSVNAPYAARKTAWDRLAKDLNPEILEHTITEVNLEDVPETAANILKGKIKGRTLVKV